MNNNTQIMRNIETGEGIGPPRMSGILPYCDIVRGNRYNDVANPDPDGTWLALITHRGENAPPRPATLPVGTRVRRGPDWRWEDQDGTPGNIGTVVSDLGAWFYVQWDGHEDFKCAYRWYSSVSGDCYDLEVVSLPSGKPAEATAAATAPKTWPFDPEKVPQGAVLIDPSRKDGGPNYARWLDETGRLHEPEGWATQHVANFDRLRFIVRRRYDIVSGEENPSGWLCVRDFTGPDWRPSDTIPAGTLKPGDTVSISSDEGVTVRRGSGDYAAIIGDDNVNVPPQGATAWVAELDRERVVEGPTILPRHHRVMLDRLRAAGWIVTGTENIDVAEAGMATRGDTRILITPEDIRVVPKAPKKDGLAGTTLDYACEQATAVLEAAAIIDTVRSEWRRANEWGAVPPASGPARRIIPVEGFHDMEHLLEDAEPDGIVPRPSR